MNTGKGILIAFFFMLAAAAQAQQKPTPPVVSGTGSGIGSGIGQGVGSGVGPGTGQGRGMGQEADASFYRLDFVIREMDGEKPIDTRHYSLWVQSGVFQNMTAGSEVPYPAAVFSTTGSGPTKSINYRSVGVSIECTISTKEGDDSPRLVLTLNISDALPPEKGTDSPAFRKVTLNARAMLNLGKSTMIGSVEDPGSRHRFLVDVTATKLK